MSNLGLKTNARRWKCEEDDTKLLISFNCRHEPMAYTGIMLRNVGNVFERITDRRFEDTREFERKKGWEEVQEKEKEDIIIRAANFRDPLAGPSIFALKSPIKIDVGFRYLMDLNDPHTSGKLESLKNSSKERYFKRQKLQENELFVQPNQLILAKIEIHMGEHHPKCNILMDVAENGIPSVGIASDDDGGKQLGDPLGDQDLAEEFHRQARSGRCLPSIVRTNQGTAVHVHLFPKKSRKLSPKGIGGMSGELREYTVKILVS
jgi:hypothetical protein